MATDCSEQLTFWNIGSQEVIVDFRGGRVVSDIGLLPIRLLDQELGVLAEIARRLPDPRAQKFVTHSAEAILTQEVYQILAGYPDGNDAQTLRHDPLFQTLVGVSPGPDQTLASGSTMNRFHHAFTRREAELPANERPVVGEVQSALTRRVQILNDYLPELFIRTRSKPPDSVILDIDPSDDPTHGQQLLSFFHGYYGQYQYFPLFVFEGNTGFPLAAWLRPGTVGAGCGAVSVLRAIVRALRAVWPETLILVRGDTGLALPEVYEFCEAEGLLYAFGFGTNAVLKARTAKALADLQTYYGYYQHREPELVHFEDILNYQAEGWSRPRRIITKIEITPRGTNQRFVVTNMSGHAGGIYRGFYVQRGDVPEKPIGELKNGLHMDRLSFHSFRANAMKLLEHVLAYALVVLHREATAAIPEVAKAEVSTLRQRLWKVGAVVQVSVRRVWFHISASWPDRDLFQRVCVAVRKFVNPFRTATCTPVEVAVLPGARQALPM